MYRPEKTKAARPTAYPNLSAPRRKKPVGPPASAPFYAKIDVVNNLRNFCGVGTLDIEMPRRAGAGMEAPDGWLWLETPAIRYARLSLEDSLHQLVDLCVLRCTYRMVGGATARVRVYLLPDDVARGVIQRDHHGTLKFRKVVMEALDVSRRGWQGMPTGNRTRKPIAKVEDERSSLFYMFNTLESPKPDPQAPWIKDDNTRGLLNDVLNRPIRGMKNPLYGYQKKTVAMMLQRELAPNNVPDSRLGIMKAPTEQVYHLDFETLELFLEPRKYEDVRGGILAEDTGTGKTFICLALILASKYQYAFTPEECETAYPARRSVPSLMDLAVSSIWKNSVPWGKWREGLSSRCVDAIRRSHGFYEVQPSERARSRRSDINQIAERIYLGTGTIVVCPPNLVDQWVREVRDHVDENELKVLVLVQSSQPTPPVDDLLQYDLIIFSRSRFDMEEKEGKDVKGRREPGGKPPVCRCPYKGATRDVDCACFDKEAVYRSPLMSIRWKRLIVDEGHSMASSGMKSKGVCVAERLPVERRWIVSATPVSGLLGLSMGMNIGETEEDLKTRREKVLEERRLSQANELSDLERLGHIVCDFLRVRPWAFASDFQASGNASWRLYINRGFAQRRPGSTTCVRNILQRLMIRHRQEDIEIEVKLPPMYHTPVYLRPGYYERLSMNLFLAALTSNAVTSERRDQDYMFHPKSRGELRLLTNNLLKRSGFYWTGYSYADVSFMVEVSESCLRDVSKFYSSEDRGLLTDAINAGKRAMNDHIWNICSVNGEMVYFLSNFPQEIATPWALVDSSAKPFAIGGKYVQEAQKFVNTHAYEPDLVGKLGDRGFAFKDDRVAEDIRGEKSSGTHRGVPQSSMDGHTRVNRTIRRASRGEPLPENSVEPKKKPKTGPKPKSAMKLTTTPTALLPEDSPLAKSKIEGTASTKLAYLLNKILEYYRTEKILIFYESEDVAFYIAQGLEILGIEYLGYQKTLPSCQRARYLVTFQHSEKYRVFLMDLSQAAFGLNVSTASRVFFVNPVWQPNVEHQALARAYRIGQKRTVHAETLILNHTVEQKMWDRRREMTADEHKESKGSIVNDSVMRDIISSLNFLEIEEYSDTGVERFARFSTPQDMFGAGKHGGIYSSLEDVTVKSPASKSKVNDDSLVVSDIVPQPKRSSPSSSKRPVKKRRLSVVSPGSGGESRVSERKTVRFG